MNSPERVIIATRKLARIALAWLFMGLCAGMVIGFFVGIVIGRWMR